MSRRQLDESKVKSWRNVWEGGNGQIFVVWLLLLSRCCLLRECGMWGRPIMRAWAKNPPRLPQDPRPITTQMTFLLC